MTGFTSGHKYGLGDSGEPCKGCGLSFSNAHFNNLPCEGKYSNLDEQALYDAGLMRSDTKSWVRGRMELYYAGTYGPIRYEVSSIMRDVLWPRNPHAGPEYAGRVA